MSSISMSPAVKQSYSASSNEYTSPEQSSLLTKITNFIGQNSLIVLGLLIVLIISQRIGFLANGLNLQPLSGSYF